MFRLKLMALQQSPSLPTTLCLTSSLLTVLEGHQHSFSAASLLRIKPQLRKHLQSSMSTCQMISSISFIVVNHPSHLLLWFPLSICHLFWLHANPLSPYPCLSSVCSTTSVMPSSAKHDFELEQSIANVISCSNHVNSHSML